MNQVIVRKKGLGGQTKTSQPCQLKSELQRQLDLPRCVCCSYYFSEITLYASSAGTALLAIVHVCIWPIETRMIERVEHFQTELRVVPGIRSKIVIFEERKISIGNS